MKRTYSDYNFHPQGHRHKCWSHVRITSNRNGPYEEIVSIVRHSGTASEVISHTKKFVQSICYQQQILHGKKASVPNGQGTDAVVVEPNRIRPAESIVVCRDQIDAVSIRIPTNGNNAS